MYALIDSIGLHFKVFYFNKSTHWYETSIKLGLIQNDA